MEITSPVETKDRAHFFITLVVGVVENDGRYLVGQRSSDEPQAAGQCAFPGGKVDKQKARERGVLVRTLREELREEVGIEIGDHPIYIENALFTRDDGATVIAHIYLCEHVAGEPMPLDDTDAVYWMTYDEVVQHCPPYVVEYLDFVMEWKEANN